MVWSQGREGYAPQGDFSFKSKEFYADSAGSFSEFVAGTDGIANNLLLTVVSENPSCNPCESKAGSTDILLSGDNSRETDTMTMTTAASLGNPIATWSGNSVGTWTFELAMGVLRVIAKLMLMECPDPNIAYYAVDTFSYEFTEYDTGFILGTGTLNEQFYNLDPAYMCGVATCLFLPEQGPFDFVIWGEKNVDGTYHLYQDYPRNSNGDPTVSFACASVAGFNTNDNMEVFNMVTPVKFVQTEAVFEPPQGGEVKHYK
ncbi:hypothetical protein ACFL27_28740 [candidate division CSSED10-310 bacterium]|uniref:Uncharacterized protein n=1 Tax=candidate division CSSED10-310 bacterium TaxID=2855610 RepID=A0ABV6Z6X9_UNCC1